MKLILSQKGRIKQDGKYYFGIVAVCNTVTLFHYTVTEKKRKATEKGETEKKEQPKLLLLPLRQKPVAFRYWSR